MWEDQFQKRFFSRCYPIGWHLFFSLRNILIYLQPYEERNFDKKMTVFKSKKVLEDVKQDYTELINQFVNDRFKLKVFNADSPYLSTRKIEKPNPKEKEIREDNKARDSWNKEVNQAINIGINPAVLHQIRRSEIDGEIRESMKAAREQERLYQLIKPNAEETTYGKVYDIFMIAIICLSMIPLMFKEQSACFSWIDFFTTIVFIVDYILRWITADFFLRRKGAASFIRYPFSFMAILDLLSILPSLTILYNGFKSKKKH